jgi:Tfp pilus assembly protein PilN
MNLLPQQSVNFCRQRPRRLRGSDPFSLAWTASAALLFGLALLGFSFYQAHDQRRHMTQLAAAEQALTQQSASLAALRQQHQPLPADPALAAETEHLTKHVEGLRGLLDRVERDNLAERSGFSAYFTALARHVLPQISLTSLRFYEQGREIELSGSALAAEQIPLLAQELGREAAFANKHFAELRLQRSPTAAGQVDFVISTQRQANGRDRR